MARVSSVERDIPTDVRRELKARLRAHAYGPLDDFVEWLENRDVTVSRSALGRWVKRLRERDEETGWDVETLTSEDANMLALWDELEALRKRETEILVMLKGYPASHNTGAGGT